jgi:HD-GYP domain-containing protein (c-di-GMP phosphodiesterase class II)
MLKRINPSQAELGMFIHKLEGSWLKHPFWKSRFLLADAATLENLRQAEIDAVLIDIAKGRDVDDPPFAETRAGRLLTAAPHDPSSLPIRRTPFIRREPAPFDFSSTQRTSTAREFGHAQSVAKRGEKMVSRVFLNARLGKAVNCNEVEPVISDIFASVQRNPHAFNGLMRCKRNNQFAYQHALAVSALMISLAKTMKLTPVQVRDAGMAGLLLDVGIGHLPIDLDDVGGDYREFGDAVLHNHTTLGFDYLGLGGGIPEEVALVALQHHERIDGSGYPNGLQGHQITQLSRMAAICDTYDMLVTDSSTKRGLDPATAIVAMCEMTGQFDPAILAAFTQAIGAYPVGSVVRLASDRLALVIDQDANDLRLPRVRTFYSIPAGRMTRPEDLPLAQCFGRDAIIGQADPEAYGIEDFAKLRLKIFSAACKAAE